MKQIKDDEPSVLVFIVKADGDKEVAVEAFRSGDYLRRTNILPEFEMPAHPGNPPFAVTPNQYRRIQQAVRFIDDKYQTDIRLPAVAAEAGMSLSHFSRIFKKVMGVSYQEYLNNRRISKAKKLLHTSTRSISEIAISLGFADPTGFGRIFKKVTGKTPSLYRGLRRK